ncbi:capsule assembly Wzi family protein [Sporomusa sp. GT1]|uniref:capsule assembly Wzi family protein n=1 Tax=Sporomusa sp. GT1 TaxID=1534747 RepID=UPI001665F069|nr:capsule assembly Wzi family protein [Sporomusa sp. GT1]
MRLEGKATPSLVVSLIARGDSDLADHLTFPSAYVKTHINNMKIQLGKGSFYWGQGSRGSLLLTNNNRAKNTVKVSSVKPLETSGIFKFLGDVNIAEFYSEARRAS